MHEQCCVFNTMVTAKGQQIGWYEDLTVREVLDFLGCDFPLLLIRVNKQLVREKRWNTYKVSDGATGDVQHVVARGMSRRSDPSQLVVTDLDGTLLGSNREAGTRNLHPLNTLGKQGILRVIAKGRLLSFCNF
jgi:sulfur carrier protein ThiS